MAKKVKKRVPQRSIETMVIPTAANAKWVAIGFLTAVITVTISVLLIMHAGVH